MSLGGKKRISLLCVCVWKEVMGRGELTDCYNNDDHVCHG